MVDRYNRLKTNFDTLLENHAQASVEISCSPHQREFRLIERVPERGHGHWENGKGKEQGKKDIRKTYTGKNGHSVRTLAKGDTHSRKKGKENGNWKNRTQANGMKMRIIACACVQ